MTRLDRVTTSPIETALSEATAMSRAQRAESHVLCDTAGNYRVAGATTRPRAGETVVAMVDAEGETLMYALRMVA